MINTMKNKTITINKKILSQNNAPVINSIEPDFVNDDVDFTPVDENTEKAAVIKELNRDVNEGDGFSSIDTKTKLSPLQISGIMAVDVLTASNFLPFICTIFTRSAKRLNVSANGGGRKDIVEIMRGAAEDEQNRGKTFFQRMGLAQNSNSETKKI
jgi:hypothetical protein